MNLHEYQSKQILQAYGLPVLKGLICYTPNEVEAAADILEVGKTAGAICVIKAQVHAGGRGKGGGVKLAKTVEEARALGEKILGMNLITPQTGEKGKKVRKVYVEAGCDIDKELYLSMLVDRQRKSIAIVASKAGGMEIEELAHSNPKAIVTIAIDPKTGLQKFQALQLARTYGIEDPVLVSKLGDLLKGLYHVFVESDLSLLEINPLVVTKDKEFVVLDAKCSIDDNALFRQSELREFVDYDEQDPKDVRATRFGLNYVALEGKIGCLVNGAGLAMATMDIIKFFGGQPANFLDVGGGASKEAVTEAFKILLSDEKVKGILVNIFGGIMKCDVIASAVVEAAKAVGLKVPLVVRLQGTNVDEGRSILSKSGLQITPATTMDDAAKKIVEAVKNL